MRMKIEDMIMFTQVAKNSSFSKASTHMNIPQPTLSRRIKQLEQLLRVTLFDRSTKQVLLTDTGQGVLHYCNEIIDKSKELEGYIKESYNEMSGDLAIVCSSPIARFLSEHFVPGFLRDHPDMRLTFCYPENDGYDLTGDILISYQLPKNENYVAQRLHTVQCYFYAAPSYIEQHGIPETLEELVHHRFIHVKNPFAPKLDFIDKVGLTEDNLIDCFDRNIAEMLACQGVGIALLYKYMVKDKIDKGMLLPLFRGELSIPQHYYVVYKKKFTQPKKNQVFIAALRKLIAEHTLFKHER